MFDRLGILTANSIAYTTMEETLAKYIFERKNFATCVSQFFVCTEYTLSAGTRVAALSHSIISVTLYTTLLNISESLENVTGRQMHYNIF